VRHGVKRGQLLGVPNSHTQPSTRLVEGELEERAALPFGGQSLMQGLAVEVFVKLDDHRFGLAPHAAGVPREAGVASALLADALFGERAARNLSDCFLESPVYCGCFRHLVLLWVDWSLLCMLKST
jgi:hypothetical protein